MFRTIVAWTLIVLAPSLVGAEQPAAVSDPERRALNNFQHEMTVCANYYLLVEQCLRNSSAPQATIDGYRKEADRMILQGLAIAEIIGMTKEAAQARMQMEGSAIMKLISDDCVNISVAMQKHLERCQQVSSDGDSVLGEYLSK